MRNANAQRKDIMIRVDASQQAPAPHVSHAETGVVSPFRRYAHCSSRATDSRIERTRI